MKKVEVDDEAWEMEAVRVARLYYRSGMTQEGVAQRLGLTRWKVNRLLAQARESGIVRIEVVPPRAMVNDLASELLARYDLVDCVIAVSSEDGEALLDEVGREAAGYLAGLASPPAVLAVSWGRTMAAVAANIHHGWAAGVRVVMANGAVSRSVSPTGAAEIAERIATAGGGTSELIPGPAVCEHATTRKMLEKDRAVAQVLESARLAPVAIFGLGALGRDSVLVQSGYLSTSDVDDLEARGAVGDVLGRYIDRHGEIVDEDLEARTLGLTLTDLRRKELTIGVAAGRSKRAVTAAALEGGLVNVLVTDVGNAQALVEHRLGGEQE